MKLYKIFLVIASLSVLIACGPNKQQEEKQKRMEDSLMDIQRNNALNNADKFLQQDSISPADTTPKHKK